MFVKGYGFLSFAKKWVKKIHKNISKILGSKYSPGMLAASQKPLDHTKKSTTDALNAVSKK